jgi:antitoxin (DNA-binding transcriptional repressor) of toxin-antitoxin stability system
MKTMTVGEFKAHFSEVLEQIKSGTEIAVTYGKTKEVVGYFVPESARTLKKRKLGILKGKASAAFSQDFKMTEEELLGSLH